MRKALLRPLSNDNVFVYCICLIGFLFQILLILKIQSNFNAYIPHIMPDDSFYYFKIAENISLGHGSAFSIGEPTNGYHPLWMIVLVAVRMLLNPAKDTFVLSALAVSATLNALSALLLHRLLLDFGFTTMQSIVGVVCFLFSPWTVNLTFSGLETPLFYAALFSFLLVVQKILAEGGVQSNRRALLLGLTAGVCMLARTDAIFFTIPLFVFILVKQRFGALRMLLVAGTIATLILLPWLLWNIQRFHTIEQTSAIAMSALNQYSVPSVLSIDYWLLSITFMLWVAYSALLPLFYTHQPEFSILVASYTSIVVATCVLGITLHRRSKTTRVVIPAIVALPVVLLIIYYFFIRFFVQIWHMSALYILVIILVVNYVSRDANVQRRRIVAMMAVFAMLTYYSLANGYFHTQENIIEQSIAYRGDAVKNLVVCATDAGYLGYYSRHTVINVDGIVNNRAKDYILLGRFSDYLKVAGCDDVMVEAQRMKFYDRNMPQSPLSH
jgi:hypothetical protein